MISLDRSDHWGAFKLARLTEILRQQEWILRDQTDGGFTGKAKESNDKVLLMEQAIIPVLLSLSLRIFLKTGASKCASGGGFGPLQAVLRGDETWHGLKEGSQTSRSEHALRIP